QTLNGSEHHFVTHTGTAYAVLALQTCSGEPNQRLKLEVEKRPEENSLQLSVNASAQVTPHGREPLKSGAELKSYLQGYLDGFKRRQTAASKKANPSVIISVSAELEYTRVHELLQLCREAGFAKRSVRALPSKNLTAPNP